MPIGSPLRLVRSAFSGYPELLIVLAAAALAWPARRPLAWLAGHRAIDWLLAALVLSTAVTVDPADLRRLGRAWPRLALVLAVGVIVLPALSWLSSRLVGAGPLRDGVMTAGLASCEIASVSTTALSGGDTVLAAGVLVGSTLATIAVAGPLLAVEAGHARFHAAGIATNLLLVVALPLAAGLLLRAIRPRLGKLEPEANRVSVVLVAALVAVIASGITISTGLLAAGAALLVFLAASALVGRLIGAGSGQPVRSAVLLTTSMRDFAVAADIANSAFGPAAAAPLGLYGVLVLVWGTAAAGEMRRRAGSRNRS